MESFGKQIRVFIVLLFVEFSRCIFGYRIIALTTTASISHFKPMEPLLLELAKRGNQITVISNFPQKIPVANYTDIDMKFCNAGILKTYSIEDLQKQLLPSVLKDLIGIRRNLASTECFLKTPSFQQILKSNQSFDLVIAEYFYNKALTVLGHLFNAPVIHISSCLLPSWISYEYGNPMNPSYIQHSLGTPSNKMSFFERLQNTIEVSGMLLADRFVYYGQAQEFSNRYFGANLPSLGEIMKNSSLILVNTHFTMHGARPTVPNVVEVGGIHIVERIKKIPQVINQILVFVPNNSEDCKQNM